MNFTNKHRGQIPDFFKDKITPEKYSKSIDYTLENSRFSLISSLLHLPLIWAAILLGFFEWVDNLTLQWGIPGSLHQSVVYCLVIGFISMILQIPFSLYSQFVIEKKYGFNRMTAKIYIVDMIKSLLLSIVLGVPLLYLVFWLYSKAGVYWWLWAFLALFGFQLFIATIYPAFLAPLFNKFTPLEDGSLKEAIKALAQKIKFKMSGVFTIDGSKRSTHSNAYFAGMGKFRRIVLFDTIREQMNEPEIIAVLAHEMGHNVKKHIQKQMIFSFFLGLFGFWILSLVMEWETFFTAFKAGAPAPHKALILFSFFSGYFTFLLTPLMNFLSRKNEYEADRFSVETNKDGESMISSLVKLSKENLSNLTPHPLYSFYHYSHPTTLERISAIRAAAT